MASKKWLLTDMLNDAYGYPFLSDIICANILSDYASEDENIAFLTVHHNQEDLTKFLTIIRNHPQIESCRGRIWYLDGTWAASYWDKFDQAYYWSRMIRPEIPSHLLDKFEDNVKVEKKGDEVIVEEKIEENEKVEEKVEDKKEKKDKKKDKKGKK